VIIEKVSQILYEGFGYSNSKRLHCCAADRQVNAAYLKLLAKLLGVAWPWPCIKGPAYLNQPADLCRSRLQPAD